MQAFRDSIRHSLSFHSLARMTPPAPRFSLSFRRQEGKYQRFVSVRVVTVIGADTG
jgi:hypothetical protein